MYPAFAARARSTGRVGPFARMGFGLVALVLFGSACSSGSTASTENSDPLTVATFEPFTGPDGSFGPWKVASCSAAAYLIAQAGGILTHKTVQCPGVDTRGDPADAVPAAQKLIATTPNLVGILGPSSDEALATVPLFDKGHIPMFGANGLVALETSTYPYYWHNQESDDSDGYVMADWAHQQGYQRVAAVFGADLGSQGAHPTAINTFTKLGGTVVYNHDIALDQSSYRTEILQMLDTKPDVIFQEADPQTSATFLSDLQELHGLIPFVGSAATLGDSVWSSTVRAAIGPADFSKYLTGDAIYVNQSGPYYDEFATAMIASKAPEGDALKHNNTVIAGFDAVNLMALSMLQAGSTKPEKWVPLMAGIAAGAPGDTVVHDFKEGKDAIAAGKKVQYVGLIGPMLFDKYRNSPITFQVMNLQTDGVTVNTLRVITVAEVQALRAQVNS